MTGDSGLVAGAAHLQRCCVMLPLTDCALSANSQPVLGSGDAAERTVSFQQCCFVQPLTICAVQWPVAVDKYMDEHDQMMLRVRSDRAVGRQNVLDCRCPVHSMRTTNVDNGLLHHLICINLHKL